MFRKILIIVSIVVVVLMIAFYALKTYTKSKSPEQKVAIKQGSFSVSITYCKPSKKNREIFGKLVPYDKVWRTGANEATEITFSENAKFGDKSIKAGTYTLFTIPKKEGWTIILNSVLEQWGAFTYDQSKDVARIEVPTTQIKDTVEIFDISIKETPEKAIAITLAWENTQTVFEINKEK